MKFKLLRVVVFLVLFFSTASWVLAQSAELSGVVTDPSGAAVSNAKVRLVEQNTLVERATKTNNQGSFLFPFAKAGTYQLIIEAPGFTTELIRDLKIDSAARSAVAVHLKVGSESQEVKVEGNDMLINTDIAYKTVIDQKFVENMPLNGRSFQQLIAITPGVARTGGDGQFSFNGQRDNSNYYTVDGISANTGIDLSSGAGLGQKGGGQVAGLSAITTTSSILSIDAMEEITIQSSTYAPEFGRSPGGQVQITSRSGTNLFHGSGFDYFRNEALDAMSAYTKWQNAISKVGYKKPAVRQNNFGGTLGGPIWLPKLYDGRKKSFFFFSYEGLRLRQPNSNYWTTPPASARSSSSGIDPAIQPYVNITPIANGYDPYGIPAYYGSFSNPSATNATSIKIDHHVSDKLSFFVRYADSPSWSTTRSLNQVTENHYAAKLATAGSTWTINNHVANEVRANWTKNAGHAFYYLDTYAGGSVPTSTMLSQMFPSKYGATSSNSTFTFGAYTSTWYSAWEEGTSVANTQRQINVVDNLSWNKGTHNIKFGVDWRFLYPIAAPTVYTSNIAFYSLATLKTAIPEVGQVQSQDTIVVHLHNLSFYAQDDWKVTPRLSVEYGLRWDYNPPPVGANGQSLYVVSNPTDPANATLAPAGTSLYSTIKHAFAPRLGASYVIGNDPATETVVHGGFGIFWDTNDDTAMSATLYYPHSRYAVLMSQPWPATSLAPPAQVNFQPPYSNQNILAFNPGFTLPRISQWNVSIDQALGRAQTFTLGYIGSIGRDLTRRSQYAGSNYGSRFLNMNVYASADSSSFNSLQAKFMRRFSKGLQAFAAYSWGKSFDTASSDVTVSPSPRELNVSGERGLSTFDIRNSFSLSFNYDLPGTHSRLSVLDYVTKGWSMDGIYSAHTGNPVTATVSISRSGSSAVIFRPDIVPGAALWVKSANAFGGKVLNASAFSVAFATSKSSRLQGTEPRGYLTGMGLSELDFTLRRQFKLSERLGLQFRVDAFNLPNQVNYQDPNSSMGTVTSSGTFTPTSGSSKFGLLPGILGGTGKGGGFYGVGNPRSMQLAMKLQF